MKYNAEPTTMPTKAPVEKPTIAPTKPETTPVPETPFSPSIEPDTTPRG